LYCSVTMQVVIFAKSRVLSLVAYVARRAFPWSALGERVFHPAIAPRHKMGRFDRTHADSPLQSMEIVAFPFRWEKRMLDSFASFHIRTGLRSFHAFSVCRPNLTVGQLHSEIQHAFRACPPAGPSLIMRFTEPANLFFPRSMASQQAQVAGNRPPDR
jgi:hypothetical protein